MLRHSYQVLLKEHQAKLLGLQIDYLKNPSERVKALMEEKEKQIEWLEKRIAEGKDPGVHTI